MTRRVACECPDPTVAASQNGLAKIRSRIRRGFVMHDNPVFDLQLKYATALYDRAAHEPHRFVFLVQTQPHPRTSQELFVFSISSTLEYPPRPHSWTDRRFSYFPG